MSPERGEKKKLADLILKHKAALNLRTVANVLKEHGKKKSKKDNHFSGTQITEPVEEEPFSPRTMEDSEWRRVNAMVKDVINPSFFRLF